MGEKPRIRARARPRALEGEIVQPGGCPFESRLRRMCDSLTGLWREAPEDHRPAIEDAVENILINPAAKIATMLILTKAREAQE